MSARYSRIAYPKRSTVNGSSPCNRQLVSVPVYMLHTFFIVHSFPWSFSGHPASHFCVLHPIIEPFFLYGKGIWVWWK